MEEAGDLRRFRTGKQHREAHTLNLAVCDDILYETQSQLVLIHRRVFSTPQKFSTSN